jgi:hypothetical protein
MTKWPIRRNRDGRCDDLRQPGSRPSVLVVSSNRGAHNMTNPSLTDRARATAVVPVDVGELVRELRDLYHGSGIALMLRLGEKILVRLYGGNESLWKSRRRKDNSFRKLETHPDLPFHASMLSRSVSAYVLSRRRSDLTSLKNVGVSHLQEVLKLDGRTQDILLDRVERERWTVQQLRREIVALSPAGTRTGGRPRTPVFVRSIRRVRGLLERQELESHPDLVSSLPRATVTELLDTIRLLRKRTDALVQTLTNRLAMDEPLHGEQRISAKARLSRMSANA